MQRIIGQRHKAILGIKPACGGVQRPAFDDENADFLRKCLHTLQGVEQQKLTDMPSPVAQIHSEAT